MRSSFSPTRNRSARPLRGERIRLALVAGLVLSLLAAAALRAAHLQIVQAPRLQERARRQHQRQIEILPTRGPILDRNGRELALSVPGWSLFADPSVLLADPEAVARVGEILGWSADRLRRRLERGGARFAWIKRGLSPSEVRALRRADVPGTGLAREPQRFYPKRSLAGQVLGFVGADGQGLGGLEYRFDSVLRGRQRRVLATRDARGRLMLPDAPDPLAASGGSLVLTLDETIQHIAEEELARAVKASDARGGVAVVVEPSTGEILALAQVPAFNPNALGRSRPADRKVRAAVDVFEPGSTLKALFVGLLLDRRLARPDERVFCENGAWQVHGRTIHDHKPHGWLTVEEILRVSSNIGVAKLSERLPPEELYRGYRAFGFGEPTGVELSGESRGLLPEPRRWSLMTPKTLAYGQGIGATALQVTGAFAALANGGLRMRLRLVREVRAPDGSVVERYEPQAVGRVISEATARRLTRILEGVVSPEGTAPRALVPGFRVAGKTGTAWKVEGGRYNPRKVWASFVGYVPSRAPQLVILAAVDEPRKGSRYGGMVAGPVFREIARRALAYLGVAPEAVASARPAEAVPAPSRRKTGAVAEPGVMPDCRGLTMRAALRLLSRAGVAGRVRFLGTGWAAQQDPAPGTRLGPDTTCTVVFRPPFGS
ncbi:penicillin-binding protein [Deferrisoma camini]|uniref:penicillin-binding protein n=1 Tax=Deferrisoma camini TaxID=1035120 RepID=UPI00046C9E70|nr:penicillin-binding protein [Deferrisoma camini]